MLHKDVETINFPSQNETLVCNGMVRTHDSKTEKLCVEDLAALERLNDDSILDEIRNRFKIGSTYSFIGDVLLSLNPNKSVPVYDKKVAKDENYQKSYYKGVFLVPQQVHV